MVLYERRTNILYIIIHAPTANTQFVKSVPGRSVVKIERKNVEKRFVAYYNTGSSFQKLRTGMALFSHRYGTGNKI